MGFVKNVEPEDDKSLIYLLYIPLERESNKLFIDGINVKKVWASKVVCPFGFMSL